MGFIIWILFRSNPADKYLTMLCMGCSKERAIREWAELDEKAKAAVKEALPERLDAEVNGIYGIDVEALLRIYQIMQDLDLANLSPQDWLELVKTAWEKDPESEHIDALAAAVWGAIPDSLAAELLARPDVKLELIVNRVNMELLKPIVRRYAAAGEGERLLCIQSHFAHLVTPDDLWECHAVATRDSDIVSCLIGLRDWDAIQNAIDVLEDDAQAGRLLLFVHRHRNKETSPA